MAPEAGRQVRRGPGRQLRARLGHELRRCDRPPHRRRPRGGATTVTIPEGLSRDQIAADVLPEGVSSDEYLELTETAPKGFDPAQYGAKNDSLEGFLFPATYDLGPNGGSQELVNQQLQAFEDNIARVDMSYAKKKNLTVYDVLIIASMIDKEVQVPQERDDVAAVIYNRLSQGMPLGIDATTRYETQNYTEQITNETLQKDTPYNTRTNAGPDPDADRQPRPGGDQGRGAARERQLHLLRGQARHLRRAQLHRQRGRVREARAPSTRPPCRRRATRRPSARARGREAEPARLW